MLRPEVEMSERTARLRDKYTFCQPIIVDDEPDAHTVWLKVEGQSFCLDSYWANKEEAEWFQAMLGKALERVVDNEATASGNAR